MGVVRNLWLEFYRIQLLTFFSAINCDWLAKVGSKISFHRNLISLKYALWHAICSMSYKYKSSALLIFACNVRSMYNECIIHHIFLFVCFYIFLNLSIIAIHVFSVIMHILPIFVCYLGGVSTLTFALYSKVCYTFILPIIIFCLCHGVK